LIILLVNSAPEDGAIDLIPIHKYGCVAMGTVELIGIQLVVKLNG